MQCERPHLYPLKALRTQAQHRTLLQSVGPALDATSCGAAGLKRMRTTPSEALDRKRSLASQGRRALKRAGEYWDKRAQQLAPESATYSLYRRIEGWLGVSFGPHVDENKIDEAIEHGHAHLLHAVVSRPPPLNYSSLKKGTKHVGTQYFKLYPGGAPPASRCHPRCTIVHCSASHGSQRQPFLT